MQLIINIHNTVRVFASISSYLGTHNVHNYAMIISVALRVNEQMNINVCIHLSASNI